MASVERARPRKSRRPQGDLYWQGVQARDARFDGVFVFAVRSTGVYCRPSCPARRPGRKQVVFFPLPEAAEGAGFRPCRRCRPREAPSANASVELVRRICRALETKLEDPHTLAALGAHAGVSPGHLQRTFKRLIGITPRQYADARRLERLKVHLREGQNVTHALYAAGYGASSRLYERAATQLGMTPGTYRRGGKGMRISYAIVNSPLGRLLVAATPRGICAVCLGNSDARLRAALASEYPNAEIRQDASDLKRGLKVILNYLKGHGARLDFPVDVVATAFQRRVWEELRRIPYGSTRSYKQVAQAIDRPGAVRAVARACATNPVALVVPCHRVIREDGSLGGYRWDLQRKQALIEIEKQPRGSARPGHDEFRLNAMQERWASKGRQGASAALLKRILIEQQALCGLSHAPLLFDLSECTPQKGGRGCHPLCPAVDHIDPGNPTGGFQIVCYALNDLKGHMPPECFDVLRASEPWRTLMMKWKAQAEKDPKDRDALMRLLRPHAQPNKKKAATQI